MPIASAFQMVKRLSGYYRLTSRIRSRVIEMVLYPFALIGHLSLEESRFLTEIVRKSLQFDGPIIEVGTLFGHSAHTIVLAKDPEKNS